MSNVFQKHKGYVGSIEVSIEDGCLHGKILFIKDMVTFEAQTVPELEREFHAAVDSYLLTCTELGIEPRKPFSGTFNIRLGEELHESAAIDATVIGVNLNEYIKLAVSEKIARANSAEIHHHHHHTAQYTTNLTIDSPSQARSIQHVDYIGQLQHDWDTATIKQFWAYGTGVGTGAIPGAATTRLIPDSRERTKRH
jgi:predicted HicB family RNase H-like nuclease